MKNGKWLDRVEALTLLGSGLGTIASIASQQFAFTAAPVSCLLLLNLANRRFHQKTLESATTSITHLDQRLSEEVKLLNQQLQARPSSADLANVRKSIQQRHDNAIAQLQHNISSRLSAIEQRNFDQLEQELAYLKTKYAQLAESIATLSQGLNRLTPANRADNAETEIAALRQEVAELQLKMAHVSSNQKHVIPQVLQDEIHQIHRRLNRLPLPFDATALKQEVDGLVKIVGDLATRRDLAKLMAEVERIRQQHQTLEQTVAPMRSINTIMRKQMDTLSTWVTTGHPASTKIEQLQTTIAQLEARLETVPDSPDINEQLSHLQEQVETIQNQTQKLDRRQKEWLGRLPAMLDASALQNQIKYLTSRLEVTEAQLSELVHNSKSGTSNSDFELLFNLSQPQSNPFESTRAVLQEALRSAQSRVIVVFPYPDRATLDQALMQDFQAFLERGGRLDIGWGQLNDGQALQQGQFCDRETSSIAKPYLKTILQQLTQLKRNYPEQFRFKVLGINENFLVCDSTYSVLGIQPITTMSVAFPEIALGVRTQNQTVIQGLIDRFDNPVLNSNNITAYLNRAMACHKMGDSCNEQVKS